MVTKLRTKDEYEVLRSEASKVMEDLSHFGKTIAEVGKEATTDVKENVVEFLSDEISSLKARVDDLAKKVSDRAKATDAHVHANPYKYILGSIGIGFLLGKLGYPRLRE